MSIIKKLGLPSVTIRYTFLGCACITLWKGKYFISLKRRNKQDFYHELGHVFFNVHRDSMDMIKFKALFGDPDKLYIMPYIEWIKSVFGAEEEKAKKGFISDYASSHPREDFCETFSEALEEVLTGVSYDYKDTMVNKKVAFVKKVIKKTINA